MHTLKIEIENDDILEKFLWLLNNLRNDGITVSDMSDEEMIDTKRCMDIANRYGENDGDRYRSVSSAELFEELGI